MNIVDPSTLALDRSVTCCFTGHRRKDLPALGNAKDPGVKRLLSVMSLHVQDAYNEGCDTFICGMAEGADLLFAQMTWDLMQRADPRRPIRLICALPYKEQRRELREFTDRYMYDLITENCPCVIISNRFDKDRYRKRNSFMVDNSSRLIAVFKENGQRSGTAMTINMASKAGLDIDIIRLGGNSPLFSDFDP